MVSGAIKLEYGFLSEIWIFLFQYGHQLLHKKTHYFAGCIYCGERHVQQATCVDCSQQTKSRRYSFPGQ